MSAISRSQRTLCLTLVPDEKKEDKDQTDEKVSLVRTVNLPRKRKDDICLFLWNSPYEFVAAHLGIDNPGVLKNLIPITIQNKIFQKGIKLSFAALKYMDDDTIELAQTIDSFIGTLSKISNRVHVKTTSLQALQRVQKRHELLFNSAMHRVFDQLSDWVKGEFRAVGVNTYPEFQKRLSFVAECREHAECRYLATRENFERRKTFDLALFEVYLTKAKDLEAVKSFWSALLSSPEGAKIHLLIENQLKHLFVKGVQKIKETVKKCDKEFDISDADLLDPAKKTDSHKQFIDHFETLHQMAYTSAKELIQKINLNLSSICFFDNDLIKSYIALKAEMLLMVICKRELREFFEGVCKSFEDTLLTLKQSIEARDEHLQILIDYYKTMLRLIDALQNNKDCDIPSFDMIKKNWDSLPESERKIELINETGTKIEANEAILIEMLENLEDQLKLGKEEYTKIMIDKYIGHLFESCQTMLSNAKETPLEVALIESYSVLFRSDFMDKATNEGITLDIDMYSAPFDLENAIPYFEKLAHERDLKKLKSLDMLYSPFVEQIS